MTRPPTQKEIEVAKAIASVQLEEILRSGKLAGIASAEALANAAMLAEKRLAIECLPQARAAIRAMEKPTAEMVNDGNSEKLKIDGESSYGHYRKAPLSDIWSAMIRAASPPEDDAPTDWLETPGEKP